MEWNLFDICMCMQELNGVVLWTQFLLLSSTLFQEEI